ncbi:DnaD domain-containing protein [Bacillus smithii]|uniref:DnaD domain-containing protein n=1 Tax=Bacillus smithii TaxID=1479 RepID=UPI003D23EACF
MSRLLLDEKPLIILPSLAEKVGLNEAIILQQLHYWLQASNHYIDGRKWIYNTYEDWGKQFPFWSDRTIRRTITKLKNKGIILTGNFNKLKIDKTTWYSIDYQKLELVTSPCGQNDQMERSNCPSPCGQNDQTITREYTENTTEKVVVANPFAFYQQNFGVLNSFITEEISQWINDIGSELVIEAMKRALREQKKWNYANGILKDWANNNLRTLEDVEAYEMAFKSRRKKNNKEIDWDEL